MKKGFIFDLDGTVYRGDKLMPGARSVVTNLDIQGFGIVFLSNKPLHSRQYYADTLDQLGIPVGVNQIVTSSYVMGYHLSETDKGATVYPVGEKPLVRELKGAGMEISEDPEEIDYVIASFDRDFHYDKLNIAFQAIKNGARFIATNPDRTCPVEDGEVPDAAGMIGAIEGVTGKKVELIAGKPSDLMVKAALDRLELPPEHCLLVGDRLETDIKMGNDHGIPTALVLTGVTSQEDLERSSIEPTYVLDNLSQLSQKVNLELRVEE